MESGPTWAAVFSLSIAWLLRPLFALLVLSLALGVAYKLARFIPAGRLKDALYKPRVSWLDMPWSIPRRGDRGHRGPSRPLQ